MTRRRIAMGVLVVLVGIALLWGVWSQPIEHLESRAPVASRGVELSAFEIASTVKRDASVGTQRASPVTRRSGVVAGIVYRDGQPAADVVVTLRSSVSWMGVAPERSVRSSASGRFSFGVQPNDGYSVIASAPGRVMARAEVYVGGSSPVPPDQILLFLGPCEAVVYGVIQDASGGPVQGARIGTSTLAHPVVHQVASDERGAYRLCVRRGLEAISIMAAGYGVVERVIVVLGARRLDVALSPAAVVEGTVVGPAGAPIIGARVQLYGRSDEVERLSRQSTGTDEDGRFRIESAPGVGTVAAILDGARTEQFIELQPGETRTGIVLQLRAGVPVRGRVLMDGEPVADVDLHLGSSGGFADTLSESEGSFTAESVPIGSVRVSSRTHRIISGGSLAVPATGLDGVEIEVAPFGSIVGRIEVHGRPAIGAQAALRWPGRTKLATADAQGALRFEGIEPGVYTLDITDDGARARAPSLSVEVTGDETVDLGIVALSLTGRIAGRVVDESSLPVVEAYVVAEPVAGGDGDGAAVTDESGGFVIDGLGLGPQAIQVRLRGVDLPRISEATPVELTAVQSEALGVTIVVRVRRGAIAGRVVDAAGAPLADVGIQVRGSGDTRSWSFLSSAAVTGLDGRFHVDNLPAGRYDLQARQRGGRTAAVSGVEAPSQGVKLVISEAGQPSPRK